MELSLLFSRILLLCSVIPSVNSQCTSCPDGIEFPDADPFGDGFYKCTNVDNYYLFSLASDSAECKGAQFEVMKICCPSQVNEIGNNNACEWCPNGVTNIGASVDLPFRQDPVTCGELMVLVAGGPVETGICGLASSVASVCCPDDESSGTFSCKFCTAGVKFPAKISTEAGNNLSCSQVQALALLANETTCDSLVKPLEESCCPNTTAPPGCEFCASGLDNPSLELPVTGITCELFKYSATFALEGTQCDITFKPAESLCCPSTTNAVGCDFCMDGLENPIATIPFVEGATCQDFQYRSLTLSGETECSGIKSVEPFCCPNTTDVVACEFCPSGLESSNERLPLLGGVTCEDFRAAAGFITNSSVCANSIKPLEGLCCPSTTDPYQCDWCSGEAGVEFPEREFAEIGLSCGTISSLIPAVIYEELCDQYKAAESLCCPSSLSSVAVDDYCHLCGNANVEMTRPDFQPFAFGGISDDPTDDQQICAQLQESFNAERLPGESCIDTLSRFNFFFSPSICGCEGVAPPNPCEFCSERALNRGAQVPGESFTCGEGFDFIQHVSPVFCSNPQIDLLEL